MSVTLARSTSRATGRGHARRRRPCALTRTEFRLLVELAGSEGRVCSREQLLRKVWGYGYFGDSRIVDVHVRRLRVKIEQDPANPRHVVTARGLGYRLVSSTLLGRFSLRGRVMLAYGLLALGLSSALASLPGAWSRTAPDPAA